VIASVSGGGKATAGTLASNAIGGSGGTTTISLPLLISVLKNVNGQKGDDGRTFVFQNPIGGQVQVIQSITCIGGIGGRSPLGICEGATSTANISNEGAGSSGGGVISNVNAGTPCIITGAGGGGSGMLEFIVNPPLATAYKIVVGGQVDGSHFFGLFVCLIFF
jgi:hypothetical protein